MRKRHIRRLVAESVSAMSKAADAPVLLLYDVWLATSAILNSDPKQLDERVKDILLV